mmetsp:Transcript_7737/g.28408  ORF Transcript_7737/g.28408 Transcript_7737/m.28408 type:complete len:202 (-) Transcript_7737:1260-1865(-)
MKLRTSTLKLSCYRRRRRKRRRPRKLRISASTFQKLESSHTVCTSTELPTACRRIYHSIYSHACCLTCTKIPRTWFRIYSPPIKDRCWTWRTRARRTIAKSLCASWRIESRRNSGPKSTWMTRTMRTSLSKSSVRRLTRMIYQVKKSSYSVRKASSFAVQILQDMIACSACIARYRRVRHSSRVSFRVVLHLLMSSSARGL